MQCFQQVPHGCCHRAAVVLTAGHVQAVREAFEKFMNMRENKPGELLAKYLDGKLRTGTRKGGTEAGFEADLDQALLLFRYLQVSFPAASQETSLFTRKFQNCNCSLHAPA